MMTYMIGIFVRIMSILKVSSSLLPLQINPEKAREEFRNAAKTNGGSGGVKDFMDGMGLGMIVDQVTLYCDVISISGYVSFRDNILCR